MIYPDFGIHPSEQLIFGIQLSERFGSMIIDQNLLFHF